MRTIRLDGSGWVDWMDFRNALLQALQPIGGHESSLDAFVDSMIYGGMLRVEPPYHIVVENLSAPDMRRHVEELSGALAEARRWHRDHKGDDVQVTLRLQALDRYPCPCCGYLIFDRELGSYDICPICFWEDDDVQLRWPAMGGANLPLVTAQKNFEACGAIEERFQQYVRAPTSGDVLDPLWRPLYPTEVEGPPNGNYWDALVANVDGPLVEPYYWRMGQEPDVPTS